MQFLWTLAILALIGKADPHEFKYVPVGAFLFKVLPLMFISAAMFNVQYLTQVFLESLCSGTPK